VLASFHRFSRFCTLQVIASNTSNAETRQKAAQEKEEALKEQSAQIAVGAFQPFISCLYVCQAAGRGRSNL
jgi:TolB-like protein